MTDELADRVASLAQRHPDNIALQAFDPQWYASLTPELRARLRRCMNSGLENPDSQVGCYACQPSDYDDLRPFFARVIARYHRIGEDARHVSDWDLAGVEGLPEDGVLDLARLGLPPLSMRVRVGRNLADLPLPGAMSRADRLRLEARMAEVFDRLIARPGFGGTYHSLTPGHAQQIDAAAYRELVGAHLMFKPMDGDRYLEAAGIAAHWPHGRGCYVSADRALVIWVGEEDHLRIMAMRRGTVLNDVFDRLRAALDLIEGLADLRFARSPDYGAVTSCPSNLGTGMRASLHLPLPRLTRGGTDARVKEIARPLGLSVRGIGGEHTPVGADGTVDISPSARLCITEAGILAALYRGAGRLIEAERAA